MNGIIRSRHRELLEPVERVFAGMRARVVGQDSALSRLNLACLATRPQTVRRLDGMEAVSDPSSVSSGAHVRLQGPPGLGKTHLASIFAALLDCEFARIECTSDLQPTDVIGGPILIGGRHVFIRGPLLSANLVLADELSNATERTQRALLAGLSEDSISVNILGENGDSEGVTVRMPLKIPFFSIITQNPITERGTYRVPRALLDRFSMTLKFRHLNLAGLMQLQNRNEALVREELRPVLDRQTLLKTKEFIFSEIKVPVETEYFISVLVRLLDPSAADELDPVFRRLYDQIWEQRFDIRARGRILSPVKAVEISGAKSLSFSDLILDAQVERAALFLRYLGKALAFTKDEPRGGMREYVIPSDIEKLYSDVMRHRIALSPIGETMPEEMLVDAITDFVLKSVRGADWFRRELPNAARKNREAHA